MIGILGLQGCYEPHRQKFVELGVETKRVVYPADLDGIDGLVMPGGESTTMLKTATPGLWDAISGFGAARPIWGICAGSILLAKRVEEPAQASLGLMDLDVVRNAYGAQNESFITRLRVELTTPGEYECIFIRAPRISRVGDGLTVRARHGDEPVMVEDKRHIVTSFHPELTDCTAFHEYFLEKTRQLK